MFRKSGYLNLFQLTELISGKFWERWSETAPYAAISAWEQYQAQGIVECVDELHLLDGHGNITAIDARYLKIREKGSKFAKLDVPSNDSELGDFLKQMQSGWEFINFDIGVISVKPDSAFEDDSTYSRRRAVANILRPFSGRAIMVDEVSANEWIQHIDEWAEDSDRKDTSLWQHQPNHKPTAKRDAPFKRASGRPAVRQTAAAEFMEEYSDGLQQVSLSEAARKLGYDRKTLRDGLKEAGLYRADG